MAHFRGEVQGNRSAASRLGHSRMVTIAQAWGGEIVVSLWEQNGEDYVSILVRDNSATYGERKPDVEIYRGSLEELRRSMFDHWMVR